LPTAETGKFSMRKPALAVVALTAVLLLCVGAVVAFHIRHVLNDTRARVRDEGQLAFDFGSLAPIDNPGFEPLQAPEGYQAGAVFQGKLYLAGSGGLAEYSSLNSPARQFRAGIELPPSPIVRLATGILRADSGPQLVLATSGDGVLWFDGRGFRQLRPKSSAARDITAILPLASGGLLIGTRQLGLLLFDGKTLTIFHPALANLNITALAGDEGDFWVGTRSRGVLHWHAGEIDSFEGAPALPDPQVEAIVLSGGKAYVGTPMGVEEFEKQGGRVSPSRTLAPGFFAHALALNGDSLTLATIDQGIREVALTPKRTLLTSQPGNEEGLEAESFFTDDGLFAVGQEGVFRRMPSGEWSRVLNAATSRLADRNISALGFAPDGRLWIGYFDHGVDILSLDGQGHAEHVEDDHVFCVNRIVADRNRNTMDVATANGLALFDAAGRERQVLLRRDGLIADQVTDVFIEANRTVVATPAGLTFIDAAGMQSIYAFHGLVNNHVYTLADNPHTNHLLAGTLGGISLIDLQTGLQGNIRSAPRNLTTANSGLKHNWTTAIAAVDDGWFVGTYGGGIMRLDSAGHFTSMDGVSAPIEINPNAMLVTARHVFAGSLGDGLLAYDRANQRWSRVSAGLPSMNVTAIAEHDGEVYVGTDNGVVRIAEDRMPW
jgi:ligand-binding sensor domain-containing protein